MRGYGYVALIVIMLGAVLAINGGCPSIGSAPPRPGTFKGSTGWDSLTPVMPEFRSNNPLMLPSLYSAEDFNRNKYSVSPNFSIRVYPGGQVPEMLGIELYAMFQKLEEHTPSGGFGVYTKYPSEYQDKTYLRPTGTPGFPDEVIERTIGGKKVYLLKSFNCPRGKWLITDAQDRTYFLEIR